MNLLQRVSRPAAFSWIKPIDANISLDAAGLVALADLTTVAETDSADKHISVIGLLRALPRAPPPTRGPELNGGEYPACAAMTSGYVFRVENQATVSFLQKVGVYRSAYDSGS